MADTSKEALSAYYSEADSWARDREDSLRSSRRIAWIIASIAVAMALFEAIALMLLTPLKTAVPYTLMVDRQTGYVQELQPIDPQLVSSRKALTQSFLVQYVIARQGYNYDALQSDYRKVALWSSGTARSGYIASMQASNPASPLARYSRSTIVDVEVKSVNLLENDRAMVRFQTQRIDAGGASRETRQWVAVIRYTYVNEPMSTEDRYFNPLGFEVVRYDVSPETLSNNQVTAPGGTAPANGAAQ